MVGRKNNLRATEMSGLPVRGMQTGATVGYEAEPWRMANALRGAMDAGRYKHVVLGLLFPKYISDAFEARHAGL